MIKGLEQVIQVVSERQARELQQIAEAFQRTVLPHLIQQVREYQGENKADLSAAIYDVADAMDTLAQFSTSFSFEHNELAKSLN